MFVPWLWDWTLILILPAFIFAVWAQLRIKQAFAKYSRINSYQGFTASEVVRMILDSYGLYDIKISVVPGELTDHYNPKDRTVYLSESVYNSSSVAAIGVAAHETGHAIQHAERYTPLIFRNALVPVVNIGSSSAIPLFILGLILSMPSLVNIGIVLFAGAVLFHFITLPVEIDASRRALKILSRGVMTGEELEGVKRVLTAAAMTYIAATLMALLQLIRLMVLADRD